MQVEIWEPLHQESLHQIHSNPSTFRYTGRDIGAITAGVITPNPLKFLDSMNIYVSLKGNKVITPTNKDQIIEGNILCLTTLWVLRRRAVNTLRNGIMTSMDILH